LPPSHKPDTNVRYHGQPGKHMLALSSSQFDPSPTFWPDQHLAVLSG
jgi:hypothetical protein